MGRLAISPDYKEEMLRIGKMTDYAIVLLTQYAKPSQHQVLNAKVLSQLTKIPLPTVSKLLKKLSNGGYLSSIRGTHGGYQLAKPADSITVAEVVRFIEGPISMTECGSILGRDCTIEHCCPVKTSWGMISQRIESSLSELSIVELLGKQFQRAGAL